MRISDWSSDVCSSDLEKKSKGLIVWTGPVLAGNRLILANSEGEVVFASPQTGEETGRMSVDEAVTLPPVVADHTLYILAHSGRISAFRSYGGTEVRRVLAVMLNLFHHPFLPFRSHCLRNDGPLKNFRLTTLEFLQLQYPVNRAKNRK